MNFSSTFNLLASSIIWNQIFRNPGPISVYSGVQPTSDTIENSWSSYKSSSSNFLAHYPAPTWSANTAVGGGMTTGTYYGGSIFNSGSQWYPLTGTVGTTVSLFTTANATANVTPVHSGTASWAIIWDNTVVSAPNAATIPTTNFIVVPVGDMTSNSAIRLITTTISTSSNSRIEDAGVTFTSP